MKKEDLKRKSPVSSELPASNSLTVGLPIAFFMGARMMGKSIVEPYDSVLSDLHEKANSTLPISFFKLGWPQMAIAMIPIVGWLLLPFLVVYQILGFAFIMEKDHIVQLGLPAEQNRNDRDS